MTPAAFEAAALALPGASLSIQWGAERVFKVAGKMFAVLSVEDGAPTASFKCSDLAYEMLTEREGFVPAPYLARAKWVMVQDLRKTPADEVRDYLAASHALVVAKLPKKLRPA